MNSTQKGEVYEKFVRDYLVLSQYKSFLWKNSPLKYLAKIGIIDTFEQYRIKTKEGEETFRDMGIDIVSKKGKHFEITQAKNYKDRVNASCLGTFIDLETIVDANHMLNYTVSSSVFSPAGFTKGFIDFTSTINAIPTRRILRELKQLGFEPFELKTKNQKWKHNEKAIAVISEKFKTTNRLIFHNPCRTGKTKVSFDVNKKLNKDYFFFFSPLIQTAKQAYQEYKGEKELLTTGNLRTFSQKKGCAYFVCYDSLNLVIEFLENNAQNCFVVVDEFHNLSSKFVLDDSHEFYRLYHSDVTILSMSFTPRVYDCDNEEDDGQELLGEMIQTISLEEAINQKIMNDFKVFIPAFSVSDDVITNHVKHLDLKSLYEYKAIHWLLHGLQEHGYKKTIVYAKSKEECVQIRNTIHTLSEFFGLVPFTGIITSDTKQNDREKLIQQFEETNDQAFLISIRIFDEAVNIKTCDSIFMTASQSKERNVQRALRPCNVHPNKLISSGIFIWCELEDEILETISSLKECSPYFVKKVRMQQKDFTQSKKIIYTSAQKQLDQHVIDNIVVNCVEYKRLTVKDKHQEIKKMIENGKFEKNKFPAQSSTLKFPDETNIGGFIKHVRTTYWKNMTDEEKNIYRQFVNWVDPGEDIPVKEKHQVIKKMFEDNKFEDKKVPTQSSSLTFSDETKIGKFINTVRTTYWFKDMSDEEKDIYRQFKGWKDPGEDITVKEKHQIIKKMFEDGKFKEKKFPLQKDSTLTFRDETKIGKFINKVRTRYWKNMNEQEKDIYRQFKNWKDPKSQ